MDPVPAALRAGVKGLWGVPCYTVSGFGLLWWLHVLHQPLLGMAAAAAGLAFVWPTLQHLLSSILSAQSGVTQPPMLSTLCPGTWSPP